MGRDITLYPEHASKKDLINYLKNLGFKKCDHLSEWPKGAVNYSWFDNEDYKSIVGVSADIYPLGEDEQGITQNKWALHVRNTYSASWHDVKMLNDVLRGARKLFRGTIKGDYGTNRYAPLWEDNSSPISRGITLIYQHVKNEISSVKFALPEPSIAPLKPIKEDNNDDYIEQINSLDPSRVLYNGLVPFAVAMFEYFFSQIFQLLIAYDKFALEKRKQYKQKIDFSILLEIANNETTIENVIARSYTFQNLNHLNKAYKEWLNIDVRKILFRKKKIGNQISYLENKIAEMIEHRHGIVHHFEIDRSLTKDGYIHILKAIEKSMLEIIEYLEKKYHVEIEID